MALTRTDRKALRELGSPSSIHRQLREFSQAARLLSSRRAHLIAKYPKIWVAVYHGRVEAQGPTLDAVLAEVDKKALPRGELIIRFIDRNQRVFILLAGD